MRGSGRSYGAITVGLVALLCCSTTAFYLPGVAPRDYKQGEEVRIKVTQLTSTKTQLPNEYSILEFCKTDEPYQAENLGEVLSGHRIAVSPYKVRTSCFGIPNAPSPSSPAHN